MGDSGDERSDSSAKSLDFEDLTDWIVEQVVDAHTSDDVKFIYRPRKYIAEGSFGKVSRVISIHRERFALKEVNHPKMTLPEVKIMTQLHHENIVRIAYYFNRKMDGKRYRTYIFMEFMPQTLHAAIIEKANTKARFNEVPFSAIVYQILRGLAYMHHRSIVHRDIKPSNVLLDMKKLSVKLCDFGSAQNINEPAGRVTYVCSRWYRAPELLLRNKDYECKVDLWSVGCVLGEMLLLRPLFAGSDSVDQLASIRDLIGAPTNDELKAMKPSCPYNLFPEPTRRHVRQAFEGSHPDAVLDLLDFLLQYDPSKRPSAWVALADPMFDVIRTNDICVAHPHLFNFTDEELEYDRAINEKLTVR
ncbi:glycogen synthase kinase-3 beta-like [Tropilaelaps mercedesae]|uniref:Glycogen synthase kinase-3 beta-like n=1 Tax=Tropilaelaps mercedesae TaxID=418985 RepID=A0A1V9XXS5_9ACAR|nr:glycogen synthase kinase-3 beta-like [Tropilaelaps mercedesae]